MKLMRRILLALAVCLVASSLLLRAQIPDDVKPILNKVEDWLDDPQGIDINMTVKVMVMKVKMRTRSKGDKMLMTMTTTMFGKTMTMEEGYDGKQSWEYDSTKELLTIDSSPDEVKNDNDFDLAMVSMYNKAKMKTTDNAYEITLTSPKDKEVPDKLVVKARRSDCRPTEMAFGSGMKKATITIESIKKGVADSVFEFDTKKYPNAKVVRK